MRKNNQTRHFLFSLSDKIATILIMAILVGITGLPLLRPGFFKLHDSLHPARLFSLDQSIRQGIFPVRWSADFGYGYGMPLFNFYAPLPYYIGEVFILTGLSYLTAVKITFGLTALLSLAGMFWLAKEAWGVWGGMISAAAYLLLPYRILDFFVRGALGELWVMALWPWLIWTGKHLWRGPANKRWLAGHALILAGIFLSHNIYGLLTLIGWGIVMILSVMVNRNRKRGGWFRLVFGMVLGLGLSAFFTLPAVMEKKYTIVNRFATTGYWDFRQHFLYFRQLILPSWGFGESVAGIGDTMSFQIGVGHLLLLIISAAAYLYQKKKVRPSWIPLAYGLIVVLAFLTNYKSQFLWEGLVWLRFIQFPWRLVGLIGFIVSLLVGSSIVLIENSRRQSVIATIVVLLMIITYFHYLRPADYVPFSAADLNRLNIQQAGSPLLVDYLPQTADAAVVKGRPAVSIEKGPAAINDIFRKENQLRFTVNHAGIEAIILLAINDFPGWQVYANQRTLPHTVSEEGLIRFSIPSGYHEVVVRFTDTPIRKIGNTISLISLCVLGWSLVKKKYDKK